MGRSLLDQLSGSQRDHHLGIYEANLIGHSLGGCLVISRSKHLAAARTRRQ
ncbi:hypothetical protein ALQ29_03395 [Pseudomonas marginalis pv. marginalis]|uniref:Uncharacterized protein n=1 Tax=Pseudomonas marginalis pv. marginalis TaxID=97473 RepID=A0A3M3X0B8_PSEMA|nr:hypothetical protein ALQ38_01563 [Pseudomonas marginalis pv. marginalis]RMP11875.1 hypothetical protein ALQ29_03395 [Pseudomonas marginalis pv. marginalis]